MLREHTFLTQSGVHVQDDVKLHILVVDDSQLQRKILSHWLAPKFDVTCVSSGEEALEFLGNKPRNTIVDLALIDVVMPGMDGFTLLKAIKEDAVNQQMKVIVMSANDKTPEAAQRSVKDGCEDYLYKPLVKDLLLKKVDNILENLIGKARAIAYEKLMRQHAQEVAEKEKEIVELRGKVSKLSATESSLETPMQEITRSIQNLLTNEQVKHTPEISTELQVILKALSSSDLYKPVFAQTRTAIQDPVAQSFLSQDFQIKSTNSRKNSIPTFPTFVHKANIEGLAEWEFYQFDFTEADLLLLVKKIFNNYDLLTRFDVDESQFEQFLLHVRQHYNKNPYHNWRHAFDITQTVYAFLSQMNIANYLGELDIFALLLSALLHDVQHPGTNNSFQVNASSDLALLYNDRSVLENHHCSVGFKLLTKYSILKGLTPIEAKEFRKTFIANILGTDPAMHFEKLTKLKQRLDKGIPWSREDAKDRAMIMETILHSADISNIAKPWRVSKIWSENVANEFFQQGDMEKEKGMPVAPFMDRTKSSPTKTSANFIDFVAGPLFQAVALAFSETQGLLDYIQENRKRLEEMMQTN